MAVDEPLIVTKRQQELFDLREFYYGDDWKEQHLLFLSQALMFACLPYKQIKARSFTRTIKTSRGTVTITVRATEEGVPLPFGKDRVILGCALTRARQKGRPWVTFDELEPLLASFGESYKNYGGSDYKRFRDRWDRLNWCAVSITRGNTGNPDDDDVGDKKFIISKYKLPKRKSGPKASSRRLTISTEPRQHAIQFGAEFWADYMRYCVPMPVPLMRLFADQPKAWDICLLVHWGSHSAIQSKHQGGAGIKPVAMQELKEILGTVDTNGPRLRQTVSAVIQEIRTVWPEVNASFNEAGDLLIGVPTDEKLLVQNGKQVEEIAATIDRSFQMALLNGD